MNRAIFLDRDGVINKLLDGEPPESYVTRWEQLEFLPGVMDAFRLIKDTDFVPIVISNQSGIGRGWAKWFDVEDIFENMAWEICDKANVFPEYYFCPHVPEDNCACRKPSPGMIYKAAIEHEIDLSRSWMVGDSDCDIWAGKNAGIENLIKVIDKDRFDELDKPTDSYVALTAPEMYCYFAPDLLTATEFFVPNIPTNKEAVRC